MVWGFGADRISADCLASAKAVLHLAGAPVATRVWTRARRKVLWDSRVNTTKLLVERMGMLDSEGTSISFHLCFCDWVLSVWFFGTRGG